jgi:hypothetical protein
MKGASLTLPGLCLVLVAMFGLSARASVVFTNDTIIHSFDTNYDGADLVVSNCTLTVNGPHAFSNVLVAAGGRLTHSAAPYTGAFLVSHVISDEPQTLIGTNAVSLVNTGSLFSAVTVVDLSKTVTYVGSGVDYSTSTYTNMLFLRRAASSTIPDGATVLVSYTVYVSIPARLDLNVSGSMEIAAGGEVRVDGRGYVSNFGPGDGDENFSSPISGGGGGYGGYGGRGGANVAGGVGGAPYGSFSQPTDIGSGGGYGAGGDLAVGGAGGGAVRIQVGGILTLNGLIAANGVDATNTRAGGGSGGSIWLTAQTIAGAGSLIANGGAGEPIHGGGGSGGRIALEADTNIFSGTIAASGGTGAQQGGAGTIYTKLTGENGQLLLDNGNAAGGSTLLSVGSGADLTVRRGAVGAVSGSQIIGKLFVSSNGTITATGPSMNITSGDTTIEPGGNINADGLNNSGTGSGAPFFVSTGVYYCGGGGHGGYGGTGAATQARGGDAFGSAAAPLTGGGPGAGGTFGGNPVGGFGGGALRMIVNGNLVLNGTISSQGKAGFGTYAGGGAGGSVYLTVGTWSGSGNVSANGGAGNLPGGGGGGGGRISVTYNTNLFSGTITAYGGVGTNIGGAGTIYVRTNGQTAHLILDNGGNAGTNTFLGGVSGMDVTITGKAKALLGYWGASSLQVGPDGVLSASAGQGTIVLQVNGPATIDAGGAITLDGAGYGPAQGFGGGFTSSLPAGGGGHGGYGGSNPTTGSAGSPYDYITAPATAGSGGGNGSTSGGLPPYGGAGGGALMLSVIGPLTVNGRISVEGRDGEANSGGGAGGALNVTCSQLFGSGIISANGGAGNNAGGGAGGRIAINYLSNGFTGTITASGGDGLVPGGAGTIYLKPTPANVGTLSVNNGGRVGATTPISSSYFIPVAPFNLTVSAGAVLTAPSFLPQLSNLVVGAISAIIIPSNQPDIIVLKDVTIAAGGSINKDGQGFGRGNGPGAGLSLNNKGAGGGYGGAGGASSSGAAGGASYGSAAQPVDRGSGGGAGANSVPGGSDGGGAVRLTVGGVLNVDGSLSANGNPGLQDESGGGAGGSIWVVANTLSGSGTISANGGVGDLFGGGGGGGGRIAIYARTNVFAGSVDATGGSGATPGQDGSVWISGLPTISGTVTDTNGQPVAGVTLQASGGNPQAITGPDGTYQVGVMGYPGVAVIPSLSGFLFVPASRGYSFLYASVTNQNFLMIQSITPTITSSLQNTNLAVGWFGIDGVKYQTFYSTNLFDWLPYGSLIVGSNATMEILVPVGNDPVKYFRVRANN